jgi:hypothetical protein
LFRLITYQCQSPDLTARALGIPNLVSIYRGSDLAPWLRLLSAIRLLQPGCCGDDLSGGRLVLGLGAGWQEREHTHYGWDLLDLDGRFARFEEGLEVVTRMLHSDVPVDFAGKYYRLQEAILLPRPARPGGPPILIGGNGARRTLPLAARYAAEWNASFTSAERFSELNALLDDLPTPGAAGRPGAALADDGLCVRSHRG